MASTLLVVAAALCALTALVHSLLGERRLIGPQLAARTGVMAHSLSRQVTRFAWHWTSVLWLLVGTVLLLAALDEKVSPLLLWLIALAHLGMGLFDAILTRGRHVGWPLITLIGGLTLLAILIER